MTPDRQLRRSLAAAALIVGVTIAAGVYYWTSLQAAQAAEADAARHRMEIRAVQLDHAVALQLDATLRSIDTALRHLRTVYIHDRGGFDRAARDVLAAYPQGMLQFVTVFGPDGYLVYSSAPSNERLYFGDREHFRVHLDSTDDQLFISKPIVGRIAGVPLIQVTRAIREGARLLGVVGIPLRPDYLASDLGLLRVDPADTLAIVRTDGSIIARSHHLDEALKTIVPADRPYLRAQPGDRGLFRSVSAVDKVPLLFSWQRLSAWPLSTVAAINEDAELMPLLRRQERERQRTGWAMALVLAFAVGVAALLVRVARKNVEATRSEARFRAIIEASPVPYALNDESERIVFVNSAFRRTFGYTVEDIPTLQAWWPKAYPDPDYRRWVTTRWLEQLATARRDRRPFDPLEVRVRARDGTDRTVLAAAAALGDSFGGDHLVMLFDITERQQAEQAAGRASRLLQEAITSIPQGFTIYDENDRLVTCNEAYLDFYRTSRDLIVTGASFEEIVRKGAARGQYKDAVGRIDEWVRERVRKHQTADGSQLEQQLDDGRWLLIIEHRTPSGYIVGNRIDITARKHLDTELQRYRDHLEQLVAARTVELVQAKDAAEASSRAKSTFLATMSHELRTPLNGIMGMMHLAAQRATDPKQADWLGKSLGAAKHLLSVINDILDMSRIDADRLRLEVGDFAVRQLVDETLQMQGEAARAKGLQLGTTVDPAVPEMLTGDATRVQQILLNFVSNAIKFSQRGRIDVRVEAVAADEQGIVVRIEVIDQGIGIHPEQLDQLFRPFTQVDGSHTRRYGGTGLGLVISKRLANLMGGEVGASSQPGVGSTFWATIRLRPAVDAPVFASGPHAEEPTAALAHRFRAARILLVDDEPVSLEVSTLLLRDVGLRVDVAVNGKQAVQRVSAADYALILMDVQMPIMNGLDATRAIRRLPGREDVPIIALTANAFDEDRDMCLAAGMNDHLGKPIAPDALYALLLRWLDRRAGLDTGCTN